MNKAIIGGTGVYEIFSSVKTEEVNTEYGDVTVYIGNNGHEDIVFLPRHGIKHSIAPHLINYRANMKALEKLGVKYILATCAVGSCNENYGPGSIIVINDFMDFTSDRPVTFYDKGKVVHTDMSDPYCKNLREKLYQHASLQHIDIAGDAVYACTQGPRFETAAEIKMYKKLGADVMGMTNVPEVVLAKELGMCYGVVGIITNWCTGIQPYVSMHDIEGVMAENKKKITQLMLSVFEEELNQENCRCNNSGIIM